MRAGRLVVVGGGGAGEREEAWVAMGGKGGDGEGEREGEGGEEEDAWRTSVANHFPATSILSRVCPPSRCHAMFFSNRVSHRPPH